MTKNEAIEALENGKKVTHYLFDPEEWMEMVHGLIVFEDGVHCTLEQFFKIRHSNQWDDGYSIHPDPKEQLI